MSVLIVDDSESNLKVMGYVLWEEHLRLVKANSGEEALKALLRPEDFALIFMDVRMPAAPWIRGGRFDPSEGECPN